MPDEELALLIRARSNRNREKVIMGIGTEDGKPPALPFGKHKGSLLPDVPPSYLQWLLRECKLSSGLRTAVADELTRRGLPVPPTPPPAPSPACPRCGRVGLTYSWMQDRLCRPRIRQSCARCSKSLGFAPQVPPFTTLADAAASPTAILDVVTRCEEVGIALKSDGKMADFASREDWLKAEPDLRALVGQCRATLGQMLGKRRK
jgi:Putative quorum-sensing-regulated virulence factor